MKQRIISAIIALIICIPIILLGGIWFDIGVSVVGCLALRELINISQKNNNKIIKFISYISLILIILNGRLFNSLIEISISLAILIMFIPLVFYDRKIYNFSDAIILFGNVVFLGFIFNLIRTIRFDDIYLLIFLLLITICVDTFAFIAGKTIGNHKFKLVEKVSPYKTVEGYICGSLVATLVASIYYIYVIV